MEDSELFEQGLRQLTHMTSRQFQWYVAMRRAYQRQGRLTQKQRDVLVTSVGSVTVPVPRHRDPARVLRIVAHLRRRADLSAADRAILEHVASWAVANSYVTERQARYVINVSGRYK